MRWFKGSTTKKGDGFEADSPFTPAAEQGGGPETVYPADPKSRRIVEWGARQDSEAVKQLLTLLLEETHPQYRREIVNALRSCPSEEVLAAMVFALRLEDRHARMAATEAIGLYGDARATEHLYPAMTDRETGVRAKAAESLGKLGDRGALKLLTQALSDKCPSVRIAAAEALGRIGNPAAVNALISAMIEANTIARAPIADALGNLGDERAIGTLVETLEDRGWDIHWAAAAALARIGGVNAVGALLTWAKRIFASELKKLSGAEKCQMVNEVMLDLFKGLKHRQLQDVTPKVDSRIIMRSWELLDASTARAGWTEEIIDNPVWLILRDEFARRRIVPEFEPRQGEPVIGAPVVEPASPLPGAPSGPKSSTQDTLKSDDVPLEELTLSMEGAPMGNGHQHHPEEPVATPPTVKGIAMDFLAFLKSHGIEDVVLVGESVCNIARGMAPGVLNLTCLITELHGPVPAAEDPIDWNAAWSAAVSPKLERLAAAMNTTPSDLVNGKVQFTADEKSIRIRYVGPYLVQDRRLTWRDSQVECKSNQVVSRSAIIAIGPLRQVFGLASTAPIDRMWIESNLQWGGDLARGLRQAEEGILDMDHPQPEPGLVDVLRTLLLKHRYGFRLSEGSVGFLERASQVIRENPDAARMQFSKKAFDRLVLVAPYEVIVEEFSVLELHTVLMDVLDASNLQKLNEILMRKESERTRVLADAQRNLDEAQKAREASQKTFDEKRMEFTRQISQFGGPQATRIDLEERLRARIDKLRVADESARIAAQRLNEITRQLQQVTAENKVDRTLLQTHREALAAKREHDAAVSDLKKEVESMRAAMEKKHESTIESQDLTEKLGAELEAATQAFDEAQAHAQAMRMALNSIRSGLEMTPGRKRQILMEVPPKA